MGVPICPRCNATIHTGAEDQCPACGYSIRRANAVFGDNLVEFTRVVDAAGALRHQERMDLLHTLEDLERNIPPVALCIYITDDGQPQEFRTHAHWILNHARIHHPSFGKREKMRAIEDAELTERLGVPRKQQETDEPTAGVLTRAWQRIRTYVRDALHPLPPPVRQEWMLILVLDVQLEMACFSWGYMLDPYINPDSINRAIISAKLQFRERAMVPGLKKVMRAAVKEIAIASHKQNKKLRRLSSIGNHVAALSLLLPLILSHPLHATSETAPPPAATTTAPDATALTPTPVQAAAPAPPPPPAPGAAASYDAPPRWAEDDYRRLMAGELLRCYTTLHSPVEEKEEKEKAKPTERPKTIQRPKRTPRSKNEAESNTKVPARYWPQYGKPSHAGLCDPQHLYTTAERNDIERTLREVNAHSNFRVYAAVFKSGQDIPHNLSAATLVTAAAQPCEYAVLLHYKNGDSPELDLGYLEIKPDDTARHEWLVKTREAALAQGGGIEGLLAAIHCIHACISPLSTNFQPITPETAAQAPLIPIKFTKEKKERPLTSREKFDVLWNQYGSTSNLITLGIVFIIIGALLAFFLLRRRAGVLYASQPDLRLSSPYGAGVSRHVRYLEGAEASKEKRLF